MAKKRNERTLASILAGASDSFWRANPDIEATLSGTEQECSQQQALVVQAQTKKGMVEALGPWIVRIQRQGKRELDFDNLVGGCKELRDAIAEDLLGRAGDAEKDGIRFEYAQKISKTETDTIVEIWIDK